MTDQDAQGGAAGKFETGAPEVGAPLPQTPSLAVGFEDSDLRELREQVYNLLLINGMILQVRLLSEPEMFCAHIDAADVVGVASLASVGSSNGADPRQAWVPFYVNTSHVVGFSPVLHVANVPAPAPAPTSDAGVADASISDPAPAPASAPPGPDVV